MSVEYDTAETLDVQGENCPMPVVKTKQTVDGLGADDVLEVLATDPGSMRDIKGWAESASGVELVEQVEAEEGGQPIYRHYVRKTGQ